MSANQVIVQGRLRPDGTLELNQPIDLPPGEVQIVVQPLPEAAKAKQDVWTVLARIWADQEARGFVPRTREEIDAEIHAMREEAEEEVREIEAIHAF